MNGKYDIIPDDLPEELAELAEIIGFEATLKLANSRGGESLYIPKLERIERLARNRCICEDFDGANISTLVRVYNLTENHIREILKEGGQAGRKKTNDKQMALPGVS